MNNSSLNPRSFRRSEAARKRGQAGIGLIEVMVAILILAFGMLGVASMQLVALRNSQSSFERSQAVVATYQILDAMRANPAQAKAGTYNTSGLTCTVPSAAGSLAKSDVADWITSLRTAQVLGGTACGAIDCGASLCKITVQWDDTRGKGGSSKQTVYTETQL